MFEWPIRVYIEDTDAGGIVFYANYLRYMERARSEWLRSLGFDQFSLMEEGVRFVVRDLNIRYRKPALLDQEVIATVELSALSKAGMTLNQNVIRRSDEGEEILVSAEVRAACIDEQGKPMAIPAQVSTLMKPSVQEPK
ncbi:MAG: tol-pal system-associated acyl-CoA thioesterase [Thalassolituus sp.]